MFKFLSGFRRPFLLLEKATSKKSVWIPQFTKKNGQVIGGHYAHVHVSDDHDDHKVASGAGSHSQKKAHAALKNEPGFAELSPAHQAALVMHDATALQDKDSMTARLATLRKKLKAGTAPTPGEWKFFHAATAAKKAEIQKDVHEAGHGALMDKLYAEYVAKNPESAAEAAQQSQAAEVQETKEKAATAPGKPSFGPELGVLSSLAEKAEAAVAAGDVATLQKMAVSLGHYQGDLLPEAQAPAQQLHDYLQSAIAHVGAKAAAGEKAPVAVPAPADKKAESKPAAPEKEPAAGLAMPEFAEGKETTGVKAHYEKSAQKVIDLANAGDVAALEALPNPGKGNSWKGKTPNSKKLIELHTAALAHAKGGKPAAAPAPAETGPKDGDTKEGAGGTLVLKDGHWVLQAAVGKSSWLFLKESQDGPMTMKEAATAWQAANPGNDADLSSSLVDLGFLSLAKEMGIYKPPGAAATPPAAPAAVAPAPAPAPAAAAATPDAGAKQALIDSLQAAKVAETNSNVTQDHNTINAIIAAVQAGDEAALLAMKFNTNTYGKKGAKLANQALAFLGSAHQVSVGQKAGAHPALLLVKKGTTPTAAPAPIVPAAAAPVAPAPSVALSEAEIPYTEAHPSKVAQANEMAKQGDLAGLKKLATTFSPGGPLAQHAEHMIELMEVKAAPAAAPGPVTHLNAEMSAGAVDQKLIDGWATAIEAGKVPTKAQAEAMAALKRSDPDAYEEHYAEALGEFAANHGQGLDLDVDAAIAKVEKLHAQALGVAKPAKTGNPALDDPAAGGEAGAAAEAASPQDGDTKQGADGMLVFMDGRWHKMTSLVELATKASSVPIPKMAGTHAILMKTIMQALQEHAIKHGAAGLAEHVEVLPDGTVKFSKLKKLGLKKYLKFPVPLEGGQFGPNANHMAQYGKALVEAMAGTIGLPVETAPAPAAASPGDAAAPAAPAAQPIGIAKTEKIGKITAMVADGWEQTGPQKGSNPGGRFKDTKGQEWYCKFPDDPEMVKNELLAAKFYQMLGAKVPELRLVKQNGKLGIASKWVDGLSKGGAEQLGAAHGAKSGFVFDAWLANWDVVGLAMDNLLLDADGAALRVDVGGSLVYRAMGGKKGAAFGNNVTELATLLDASKNGNSAAVFKGITKDELEAGAKVLAKMHPNQIKKMCYMYGPGTRVEQADLAEKLAARREFILQQLGIADPWNAPPPDITNLPVNPADLPPPIDFNNYPGKGGPLSSKAHINNQNTIDDKALINFAKRGNLAALQKYEYDAYDKESGAYIGKKPIVEHPAKDIKNHWASMCDLLTAIAHPPVEGLDLPPIGGGSIEEVSEAAGYIKPGENINTVSADKIVGFWMKLGHVGADAVADLKPAKITHLKTDFVTKAKSWYKNVSQATKALCNAIQDSGSNNRFWNNGAKQIGITSHGHSYNGPAQSLANTIYNEAYEFEEGETVGRWMNMPDTMKAQLLKEGAGLVLQNADSMCTSIFKNWGDNAHFGSGAYLNIHFAKGAKAMASIGTGRFSSSSTDEEGHYVYKGGGEMEVTTLMGQRFVVLGVKKGNASSADGITLDLLALPPHDGYIAALGEMAALGKSFTMEETSSERMVLLIKRTARI